MIVIHRLVGEGAPHPLERASIRIEDHDTVIAVTVCHERFVGLRMDPRDKASPDIFWLRAESLEEYDNLVDPDVLAQKTVENVEGALEPFREIAADLRASASGSVLHG